MTIEDNIKATLIEKQVELEEKIRHYTANTPTEQEEIGDYAYSMGQLDLIHELIRVVYNED